METVVSPSKHGHLAQAVLCSVLGGSRDCGVAYSTLLLIRVSNSERKGGRWLVRGDAAEGGRISRFSQPSDPTP